MAQIIKTIPANGGEVKFRYDTTNDCDRSIVTWDDFGELSTENPQPSNEDDFWFTVKIVSGTGEITVSAPASTEARHTLTLTPYVNSQKCENQAIIVEQNYITPAVCNCDNISVEIKVVIPYSGASIGTVIGRYEFNDNCNDKLISFLCEEGIALQANNGNIILASAIGENIFTDMITYHINTYFNGVNCNKTLSLEQESKTIKCTCQSVAEYQIHYLKRSFATSDNVEEMIASAHTGCGKLSAFTNNSPMIEGGNPRTVVSGQDFYFYAKVLDNNTGAQRTVGVSFNFIPVGEVAITNCESSLILYQAECQCRCAENDDIQLLAVTNPNQPTQLNPIAWRNEIHVPWDYNNYAIIDTVSATPCVFYVYDGFGETECPSSISTNKTLEFIDLDDNDTVITDIYLISFETSKRVIPFVSKGINIAYTNSYFPIFTEMWKAYYSNQSFLNIVTSANTSDSPITIFDGYAAIFSESKLNGSNYYRGELCKKKRLTIIQDPLNRDCQASSTIFSIMNGSGEPTYPTADTTASVSLSCDYDNLHSKYNIHFRTNKGSYEYYGTENQELVRYSVRSENSWLKIGYESGYYGQYTYVEENRITHVSTRVSESDFSAKYSARPYGTILVFADAITSGTRSGTVVITYTDGNGAQKNYRITVNQGACTAPTHTCSCSDVNAYPSTTIRRSGGTAIEIARISNSFTGQCGDMTNISFTHNLDSSIVSDIYLSGKTVYGTVKENTSVGNRILGKVYFSVTYNGSTCTAKTYNDVEQYGYRACTCDNISYTIVSNKTTFDLTGATNQHIATINMADYIQPTCAVISATTQTAAIQNIRCEVEGHSTKIYADIMAQTQPLSPTIDIIPYIGSSPCNNKANVIQLKIR